jgi:hypothetical protein
MAAVCVEWTKIFFVFINNIIIIIIIIIIICCMFFLKECDAKSACLLSASIYSKEIKDNKTLHFFILQICGPIQEFP